MRAPTGLIRRLRLSAVVCLSLVAANAAFAQQIQFGFAAPAQVQLSPPRVELVSGPTAARLEQARALAAEQHWDDTVDIYQELIAQETDRVVEVGDGRFLSLRDYCHLQLARLPADALAIYRRQVDPLAEQWYRGGVSRRDEARLRRVVDGMFCSSWGDDALLALGELALERGDYSGARRWWTQLSPLLRDPGGLPEWITLRDVDFDTYWPEIQRRWDDRSQPPDWLAYPDTQLDLAGVRARLVLVSIRAGQRDRAKLELDAFRRFHPQAVGQFGGQDGSYAAALERLLMSAEDWPATPRDGDWPTFAGSPSRCAVAAPLAQTLRPAWAESVPLANGKTGDLARSFNGLTVTGRLWIDEEYPVDARQWQRSPISFPIVVDRTIVVADTEGIRAVDLSTGTPAITSDGKLSRSDGAEVANPAIRLFAGSAIPRGVPRETLTESNAVVYGRVGRPARGNFDGSDISTDDAVVGFDLARDGLLTFRRRPPDGGWSFDGVPLADGRRIFVALRNHEVTAQACVACFDASTQSQLWQTAIGFADTPESALGTGELTHNLLTCVGDRIYFNTNLGVVAALDAEDGRICWLYQYERVGGKTFAAGSFVPRHFERDPSPCLYHDGLLVVAPSDAPSIFALDADTGERIWITKRLPDALHLLGVVQQNLIVAGNRLSALDVRSGTVQFIWPESEHAGIRGIGRGVIAGEEVFWPTRTAIYVMHALTGEQTRTPISLAAISENGANLVAAQGHLIVAGLNKLMALAPSDARPQQ